MHQCLLVGAPTPKHTLWACQ